MKKNCFGYKKCLLRQFLCNVVLVNEMKYKQALIHIWNEMKSEKVFVHNQLKCREDSKDV